MQPNQSPARSLEKLENLMFHMVTHTFSTDILLFKKDFCRNNEQMNSYSPRNHAQQSAAQFNKSSQINFGYIQTVSLSPLCWTVTERGTCGSVPLSVVVSSWPEGST